jgi:hypothetical protein
MALHPAHLADDFDTPNAPAFGIARSTLSQRKLPRAGIGGLREGDHQGRKIFKKQ